MSYYKSHEWTKWSAWPQIKRMGPLTVTVKGLFHCEVDPRYEEKAYLQYNLDFSPYSLFGRSQPVVEEISTFFMSGMMLLVSRPKKKRIE